MQAALVGSIVASNRAGGRAGNGGGLSAADGALIKLVDSFVQNNTVTEWGGGVRLLGQSSLAIQNSSIMYNSAVIGGGVSIAPNASVPSLTALLAAVTNNTASVGGHNVAADPVSISLLSGNSATDYVSRAGASEGALAVRLATFSAAGIPAPGVLASAVMEGSQTFGANTSDEHGTVYMFLRIRKPPGQYNVSIVLPEFADVPAAILTVHVRGCIPGEVAPIANTCEPCVPGFYSLDPSAAVCEVCPAGASCAGGAAMVPLPGWWNSAVDSAQMHR
jgi:hypothetical protein